MTSAGDRPDEVWAGVMEQIKRGDAPWQKPWKPGERVEPVEGFGRMIENIGKPEERIGMEAPDG